MLRLTFLFLFTGFIACGQAPKKHIVDPRAKKLSDSAVNLGLTHERDRQKAIQLLDQATSIDSNYFMAYYYKSMFQLDLKLDSDAIVTTKSLIRIKPAEPRSYMSVVLGLVVLFSPAINRYIGSKA